MAAPWSPRPSWPRLAICALALGLAGLGAPKAESAERLIPSRSGLPWASGASVSGSVPAAFETWRHGRELDVRTVFFGIQSWSHQLTSARALRRTLNEGHGRLVVALGLVPVSHAGQLEECAAGLFDAQIRQLTSAMLNHGAQAAARKGEPIALRLGWEANNTNGIYPWRATGDGTSWRDCFKRWVDILDPAVDTDGDEATPPERERRFLIVWNMANRGDFTHPIDNLWPGDPYVDIVGSQFYDRCPPLPAGNEAEWEKRLNLRAANGNPSGPQAWLDYARSKGKTYAIPEWGVGGPQDICAKPGIDNPYFMRKMYEFFWKNAADIAFEAYFNGHGDVDDRKGSHMLMAASGPLRAIDVDGLDPTLERYNPLSAATYRDLWGKSVEPLPPELPIVPPPATDTLYWLRYVASYPDLVLSLGAEAPRAFTHWRVSGRLQGRAVRFDPVTYLDRNPDLKLRFRNDWTGATRHYITTGFAAGLAGG